jgi:ribosomal-protein-alanine N-acetyltransferase
MKLETKRLILRKPNIKDIDDVYEGISEYDVAKRLSGVPYPYIKKGGIDWIKRAIKSWNKKEKYHFLIELKSEKKVIGCMSLVEINNWNGTAKTGSWINKKYWRNGYIKEAKIAVNDFAFNELKLRRLESPVFSDNEASNATQKKMGYKLEGVKRKAVKSKTTGKIYDINIYGLLKEDWKKRRVILIKNMKNK